MNAGQLRSATAKIPIVATTNVFVEQTNGEIVPLKGSYVSRDTPEEGGDVVVSLVLTTKGEK